MSIERNDNKNINLTLVSCSDLAQFKKKMKIKKILSYLIKKIKQNAMFGELMTFNLTRYKIF
jgi:hypothetical protein